MPGIVCRRAYRAAQQRQAARYSVIVLCSRSGCEHQAEKACEIFVSKTVAFLALFSLFMGMDIERA